METFALSYEKTGRFASSIVGSAMTRLVAGGRTAYLRFRPISRQSASGPLAVIRSNRLRIGMAHATDMLLASHDSRASPDNQPNGQFPLSEMQSLRW